jgi:small subunit ribosomal protein S15
MTIKLDNKQDVIKAYQQSEGDTGSVYVQVALLSQKIKELTEHLKINKKDFQGRRGLLMMVGKRKRLLSYLKKENIQEYRSLIEKLGIRG